MPSDFDQIIKDAKQNLDEALDSWVDDASNSKEKITQKNRVKIKILAGLIDWLEEPLIARETDDNDSEEEESLQYQERQFEKRVLAVKMIESCIRNNWKSLDLSNLELDSIPKEIFYIVGLESLNLSRNKLTKLNTDVINNPSSLKELNISNNPLGKIADSILDINLSSSLESIILSYGQRNIANQLYGLSSQFPNSSRINFKILRTLDDTQEERKDRIKSMPWLEKAANKWIEESPQEEKKYREYAKELIEEFIEKDLEILDLHDLALTSFPKEFWQIPYLRNLNLSLNKLDSLEIPKTSGDEEFILNNLDLSKNSLATLPNEIRQFKLLESLSLRDNKFSHIPNLVLGMNGLRVLDVGKNNISNCDSLENRSLEKIYLDGNKITSFPDFSNFKNLKKINLADNQIERALGGRGSRSIEKVDLSRNNLKSFPAKILANFPHLQELVLQDNNIETFIGKQGSDSLQKLDLSGNKIKNILSCEGSFPALTSINLSNNQLKEVPQELFARKPNLHLVDLRNNEITNRDFLMPERSGGFFGSLLRIFGLNKSARPIPHIRLDGQKSNKPEVSNDDVVVGGLGFTKPKSLKPIQESYIVDEDDDSIDGSEVRVVKATPSKNESRVNFKEPKKIPDAICKIEIPSSVKNLNESLKSQESNHK